MMKELYRNVILVLFACLNLSAQGQILDTSRIMMTEIDGDTPISSDDAEQINDEIDKLFDDDLDAGWEGDEFNIAIVGLRFNEIGVPQGAKIDSAFIEVFSHEDEGDPCFITIWGQDSDDAETFNDMDLITDRPRTDADVRWEITEDWTIWTRYRTADFAPVVQEIVDRVGWEEGNSMVFVFEGEDQGPSDEDNARDMESFENVEDPDDGGDGLNHPERIPKLYIYWSGTSTTSEIATRDAIKVEATVISSNRLIISYDGSISSPVALELFTATGAHAGTLVSDLPNGIMQSIQLPDLEPGIYVVQAVAKAYTQSFRIVVR